VTGACLSSASDSCIAADLAPGWKLALQSPGEKGLSAPLISNGAVLFTSYVPSSADAVEDSQSACSAAVGLSRVYWVALGDGSPSLPLPGILTPGDEGENPPAGFDRFRAIGPGLLGDVVPYHDQVLIPGTGIGDASLVSMPGSTLLRTYWREEEVDAL
jgi:type IV pilus assembly protein PilY1